MMDLTKTERCAINGLAARYSALQSQVNAVNAEDEELAREIEARLGLPTKAIGTTHEIRDFKVIELPKPIIASESVEVA